MLIYNKNLLDEKSKYIVSNLEDKLKEKYLKYFIEFCMAGEEKIAYEILCDQIYEFDIKIQKKVFDVLKDMCIYYELDSDYWKNLKNLIIK